MQSVIIKLFVSISLFDLTIYSVNSLPPVGHVHNFFRNITRKDNIAFPDEIEHIHHHHHHHHDHNYNPEYKEPHNNFNNKKQPQTDVDFVSEEVNSFNKSLEIPLDIINNINEHNITDVIMNYVDGSERPTFFQSRFGEDEEGVSERNSAVMAKAAGCIPELQSIKLVAEEDPSVLYIPQCTRVEKCGGCCSHRLLSCQPTEDGIETITYQVLKTKYTGGKKLKFVGKEAIVVERHTKCKCNCKVKAEDCNIFQEYRKNECSCVCANRDEEKKCEKDSKIKLWNPETCSCECRNILQCSTGYKFDFNECGCVVGGRRYGWN